MEALVRANEVRVWRANLKREVKAGTVALGPLIADPPCPLAVPTLGQVKANKLLANCRISIAKTVAGLSDRQRDELVAALAVIEAGR